MNTSVTQFLDRLRNQLATIEAVASATLYGSYVRGELRDKTSDINLAVIVRGADLGALVAPLQAAWRAARVDPWIARVDELPGLVDVFATRVREIQRRHVMLVGDDPWTGLTVPRAALRFRIEQELRNHQMRLRHAEVLSDGPGQARQLFVAAGALRHDLGLVEELAGAPVPDKLGELAAAAAARLDLAPADVHAVLAFGRGPDRTAHAPLAAATRLLDRAVAFVDAMEVV
jgi:hypothetical protein